MKTGHLKIHKAWGVLAVLLAMTTACAIGCASFATNLSILKEAGGFTASQTSSIVTVRTIANLFVYFFTRKFYKYMKVRNVALIALGMEIAAFVLFGYYGRSLYACYAAAVLIGCSRPFIWTMGASLIINNWMKDYQTLALSIASCGSGIASIVGAPLIQRLYDGVGVEMTFILQAGFMLVVAVLLFLVVTDTPAEQGLAPYAKTDGKKEEGEKGKTMPQSSGAASSAAESAASPAAESALASAAAIPKTAVILAVVASGIMGIAGTPSSVNLSLNFKTMGIDPVRVASAISLYGFILIFSKLLMGILKDKLGGKKATLIIGTIQAAGMFLCFFSMFVASDKFMYPAVAVYALGSALQALGYATWARDFSDETTYVKIFNYAAIATSAGELIGHEITGRLTDLTGLYNQAYLMYALVTVAVILMIFVAYRIKDRANRK